MKNQSFTFIELLIVMAIVSIFSTIIIVTIKPAIIFSKARDSQRITDLNKIDNLIHLAKINNFFFNVLNYASSNVVYLSLPDSSSTCSSYISQLPPLPSGWSYRCSATPTDTTGQGWIPIPFSSNPLINLSRLPLDPINKPPYYYTFVVGGSYELTAFLENEGNKNVNGIGGQDNGTSWNVYEVGTNKKLTPFSIENGGNRDKFLVGYWPFDESTGTIAYDVSGNNNHGNLYNFNWTTTSGWINGRINNALSTDGINDRVEVPHSVLFDEIENNNEITIVAWIYIRSYTGNWWGVVEKYEASGDQGWTLEMNNISGLSFNSGIAYTYCNFIPQVNQWHFLAVSYKKSNGVVNFFVNDKKECSKSFNYSFKDTYGEPLYFGFNPGGGDEYINGIFDEVRIYKRALTDEEIKLIYESSK